MSVLPVAPRPARAAITRQTTRRFTASSSLAWQRAQWAASGVAPAARPYWLPRQRYLCPGPGERASKRRGDCRLALEAACSRGGDRWARKSAVGRGAHAGGCVTLRRGGRHLPDGAPGARSESPKRLREIKPMHEASSSWMETDASTSAATRPQELQVTKHDLSHLPALPARDALAYRWALREPDGLVLA